MDDITEQDKSSLTPVCPHVDYRLVWVVIFAVYCILIFVVAPAKGVRIPVSVNMAFLFCAIPLVAAFRLAGKNVFSLSDEYIELYSGVKIYYKNIKYVVINKRFAEFSFSDADKKEKKARIIFNVIKGAFRGRAHRSLAEQLRQHGVILYPDKTARNAAEKIYRKK